MGEKNFDRNNENVIEWINGDMVISVTACEMKLKNRLTALHDNSPEAFKHFEVNADGSIWAVMPRKWLRLNVPVARELTEEQRREVVERLNKARWEKTQIHTDWECSDQNSPKILIADKIPD